MKIRGWNILSGNSEQDLKAIHAACRYNINQIQLSHHIIMHLYQIREPERLDLARRLIKEAHSHGIDKVLVWDHALYDLNYYPDEFKTTEGFIDLDNPGFWKWMANDYRSMLDSLKDLDGLVLTFIETGARVEYQHSVRWISKSEKLANLVDSIAGIVIDERGMDLFIRTFTYSRTELDTMLGCINLIKHPKVRVMSKEVPHDFFLTQPVSAFVKNINKEVLIEFDLGHEYNGEGVTASILPEITVERWKYYARQPNVIGYVARTDRWFNSQNIGRPTEVNLYTLYRIARDTSESAAAIVKDFISMKYGPGAVPFLTDVFLETDDIITSVYYTLGLHTSLGRQMDFESQSIYSRHCSGKWLDPPVVKIGHDVDRTFHYWKDIVEHLAPARYKAKELEKGVPTILYEEVSWVIDSGWVTPVEKMKPDYLKNIVTEKEFGVRKAKWALDKIKSAKKHILSVQDYEGLLHLYERTYLTARIYLAGAKAYYGYRYYLTDSTDIKVNRMICEGLSEIKETCHEMMGYPDRESRGQYVWIEDADRAQQLYNNITNGWIVYGNRKFKFKEAQTF